MSERPQHPSATDGEVWLGNCYASDFWAIGWTTKRKVMPCIDSDGRTFRTPGFVCVLVKRAEIEAAGVAIPARGPIDHRW